MGHTAKLFRVAVLGAALSSLLVVGAAAASIGVGTVTADALRMRDATNTGATVLATAPKGESVIVLAEAGNGWYQVDYKSVQGYMSGEFLQIQTKAEAKIGYGKVKTDGGPLNLRSGAGTGYDKVASLEDGSVVTIIGVDSGWYKISCGDKTGYVSSDYMLTVKDGPSSRSNAAPAAAATSDLGQQIVDYAKQFMGVPYVYGANGPKSFDCSGFTKYVYAHFGYTLNRSATAQLSNGVSVSKSELQPGDLVFFKYNTSKPVSHVGIYIGGGRFIHASTNQYEVQTDDLTSGHYNRVYVYGRHII
ncbi:MAG: SH3 domain-containing C40 family peptidase [Pseudoflavonifractor sp.]